MSVRCGSRHSLESVSRIQLAHMFQFRWGQTGAPGVSEQCAVPAVLDQSAIAVDAIVPVAMPSAGTSAEGNLEKRRRIVLQNRQFGRTQIVHALRRRGQTTGLPHLTSEQKQDCTRTNEGQTWHAITQKHYFTSHWYTWRKTDVSNHDQHNRGAAILSHLAAMRKF